MSFETVLYEAADGVARITMNRPDKHNALNHQLLDDLDAAFAEAEADETVACIILSGAGKSFCSGYDTKGGTYYINAPNGAKEWNTNDALAALDGIEARYLRIWNCPKITIAQVHGNALAAGCYLTLLCDIAVAAETAKFGHPARSPIAGVTSMPLWQVALPLKKARYLLYTKRIIDAKTAERFDLVTMAVPETELAETVNAIAKDCADLTPVGARYQKQTLNTALNMMGLDAMFRYHGQMNALGRLSR